MLGFSFPKFLVLLVILIVIWNFFKYLEKNNKNSIKKKKDNNEEELTECYKCGGFYDKAIKNKCPMCYETNKK